MNVKVISFVILVPLMLIGQRANFDWLTGKWKVDSSKSEKYEEWHVDGKRLKGEGYTIKDGQKHVFETLFIENFAGQWAYIALPKGQQITLFALVSQDKNTYIFENKEHDFPGRIIYAFDGEKAIHVSVQDGNDPSKGFKLTLVKIK